MLRNDRNPLVPKQFKTVFLDRDGTINIDKGYVTTPDRLELIDDAADAIAKLKSAGFKIVIVSNQSAVGRGMATKAEVECTNDFLQELLVQENSKAKLDLILFNIQTPEDAGNRRKPGIGMLEDMPSSWSFDPRESWMVGDKSSDLQFGENIGLSADRCILVATGYGEETYAGMNLVDREQFVYKSSLMTAVEHIVNE